ncbi:MAG TPA: SDR family NAD(P)-dependent oxidoreductase, partial [Anaerovoracaceae bacterium]|nr:SDR family NAD(P)-dependent oxidoreductase [Anaerovoracaceae bacterium]
MKMFSLNGKNAVILGGGGILGTSMAEGLAEAGADLAVCDIRAEIAQSLAKKIESEYGVKAKGYELDAMNIDSLKRVCSGIMKE